MINHAEMIRGADIDNKLPVLTDPEIQNTLCTKIDAVCKGVEGRIRIGLPYDCHKHLFTITAEEYSPLPGFNWLNLKTGRVKTDHLQIFGLQIMKRYGLNEDVSLPEYTDCWWTNNKNGIINNNDGTSSEFRLFPSQTIDGLAFERKKSFETATGKPISISWSVIDKAPLFRLFRLFRLGNKH